MRGIEPTLLATGILLALTLGSGIGVSRTGRPNNTGIFTLHKLIALATVVLAVLTVRQMHTGAGLSTLSSGTLALMTGVHA